MHCFARCLVVLFLCVPVAVHAACTVSLTAPTDAQSGQTYRVLITPPGPAYKYVFTEQWSGRLGFNLKPRSTVSELPPTLNPAPFNTHSFSHLTTVELPVTYRVIATNTANPSDLCVAEATVLVHADPALDRATRRGVIPVVGTTGGLNGSLFKTSLKLAGNETLHGRLVFHPIGKPGSDSDPSISYSFPAGDVLVFDDLMSAFGLTGVGSLDIIPEGTIQLPGVEARIYNQSAQGTFGTMEPVMFPAEFFGLERPPELQTPNVGVTASRISEGARVNLGIRSLADSSVVLFIRHADGSRSTLQKFFVAADTLLMGTPSQLAAPYVLPDLLPGDDVTLYVESGAGIPFYTVTDNRTNDPAINFPVLGDVNLGRYNN